MSADATAWVIKFSPYTGTNFVVHLMIADVANTDYGNTFFMRQGKLAVKSRTTRSTVSKVIKRMVADGLLEMAEDRSRNGRNNANVYRLLMPAAMELVYDNKTRSGVPGDANAESPDGRTAVSFRRNVRAKVEDDLAETGAPTLLDGLDDDGAEDVSDDDLAVLAEVHRDLEDRAGNEGASVDVIGRDADDEGEDDEPSTGGDAPTPSPAVGVSDAHTNDEDGLDSPTAPAEAAADGHSYVGVPNAHTNGANGHRDGEPVGVSNAHTNDCDDPRCVEGTHPGCVEGTHPGVSREHTLMNSSRTQTVTDSAEAEAAARRLDFDGDGDGGAEGDHPASPLTVIAGNGEADGYGDASAHTPAFPDDDEDDAIEVEIVNPGDDAATDLDVTPVDEIIDADVIDEVAVPSAADQYDALSDQPDPDAVANRVARDVLSYYIQWRYDHGIGDLRNGAWKGVIGKQVKMLLEDGWSARGCADVVTTWHDRSVAKAQRTGGDPLHPGSIRGIAQGMLDANADVKHGVDGEGTTYKQAAANERFDNLNDLVRSLGDATATG